MTGEWISVNERLPEDGQRVLAMTAERGVTEVMMANAREQESGEAMSGMSLDEPVAWAVINDRGVESVQILEAVAADRARHFGGEVVPLYSHGVRFIAARESIGGLLNAIKRFIDQTDPWVSQFVNRGYKVNTPEARDARRALRELRKRLEKPKG